MRFIQLKVLLCQRLFNRFLNFKIHVLYVMLYDFRMANPMMQDSVWTKQQKYEEAEALYQQVLAGTAPKGAPKGAGGGKGAKVV